MTKPKQPIRPIALSINEVAAMLSRWTIAAMLESGALPGFVLRTGRKKKIWRVREDALLSWISTKEAETQKLKKGG